MTVTVEGPATVVAPRGEIDLSTAPALEDRLKSAAGDGATALIVDLEAVTFMDSSGLQALCTAYNQLDGCQITVRNAKGGVRKVLEITGMADVFGLT